MFKRYADVLMRLEEMGPRMGTLSNRGRDELHSLLEEQAWLGETLVKQAKSVLQDIDQSMDQLFEWLIEMQDVLERAGGPGGTTDDVLGLEQAVVSAGKLREQLRNVVGQNGVMSSKAHPSVKAAPALAARLEAAPAGLAVLEPQSKDPAVSVSPAAEPAPAKARKKKGSQAKLQPLNPRAAGAESPMLPKGKKKKGPGVSEDCYQPPRELVTSLAEKLAPVKDFYHDSGDDPSLR